MSFSEECSKLCIKCMSKMKDVVLTIFLVLLGTAVFSQTGQTGSIKGKIIDAKTKEALEFVNVSIRTKDSGKTLVTGTVTDSTGVFHLSRIKNGTYILSASYIGYRTLEKEFTISSKERNINLEFRGDNLVVTNQSSKYEFAFG